MYLQHALNGLGFDAGPVDGVAGKRTHGAIRDYQSKRGVAQEGEISPDLLRRLLEEQANTG
jgi:peptidoglycan hydrolase-like protein with peptidoglycan-binding domain